MVITIILETQQTLLLTILGITTVQPDQTGQRLIKQDRRKTCPSVTRVWWWQSGEGSWAQTECRSTPRHNQEVLGCHHLHTTHLWAALQRQASQTGPCTQISWGPYYNTDYDSINVCVVCVVVGGWRWDPVFLTSSHIMPKFLVLRLPE